MRRWGWPLATLLVVAIAGCGDDSDGNGEESDRVESILSLEGDADAASSNYNTCVPCHGADGSGTPSGDDLTASNITDREAAETILFGKGSMAPYGSSFSDQEIADLVALVQSF